MSVEAEDAYTMWEQSIATFASAIPREMTNETLNEHSNQPADVPSANNSLASSTITASAADASLLRRLYTRARTIVSSNGVNSLDHRYARKFTVGERVADLVSQTMGSWRFVIVQSTFLAVWLVINASQNWAWDPYPFILLNLMLSFQAAYTAPIIMMSQNRQADIDRMKASDLHEKVDHIRLQQVWAIWDQLTLIQQQQTVFKQDMDNVMSLLLKMDGQRDHKSQEPPEIGGSKLGAPEVGERKR